MILLVKEKALALNGLIKEYQMVFRARERHPRDVTRRSKRVKHESQANDFLRFTKVEQHPK
jgi:hypothetical protein